MRPHPEIDFDPVGAVVYFMRGANVVSISASRTAAGAALMLRKLKGRSDPQGIVCEVDELDDAGEVVRRVPANDAALEAMAKSIEARLTRGQRSR